MQSQDTALPDPCHILAFLCCQGSKSFHLKEIKGLHTYTRTAGVPSSLGGLVTAILPPSLSLPPHPCHVCVPLGDNHLQTREMQGRDGERIGRGFPFQSHQQVLLNPASCCCPRL